MKCKTWSLHQAESIIPAYQKQIIVAKVIKHFVVVFHKSKRKQVFNLKYFLCQVTMQNLLIVKSLVFRETTYRIKRSQAK